MFNHHHTTLTKDNVVKKPTLFHKAVLGAAIISGPVGFTTFMAIEHPDQVKSTLNIVKKDVVAGADTIGDVAKKSVVEVGKGVKSVGNGIEKMMLIPLIVGSLVVVMMILKK